MGITNEYTIENWRTGEIEVHNIPEAVLNLPFEDVLETALGNTASIDLNLVELLFLCIFSHNGWQVARMPMSRDDPVMQPIAGAIEQEIGVSDALFGPGVPDFFLWNSEDQHRFVEIKASESSLNENQLDRAESYDSDLHVAQLAYASEDISDEEIKEENRIS